MGNFFTVYLYYEVFGQTLEIVNTVIFQILFRDYFKEKSNLNIGLHFTGFAICCGILIKLYNKRN